MATFACRSRDASGRVVEKQIEAVSEREAMILLEQEELSPIRITKVTQSGSATFETTSDAAQAPKSSPGGSGRKVKRKELMQFSLQLSSSLSAGVPLLSGLRSIQIHTKSEAFKEVLSQMTNDLEGGLSLSVAMSKHPRVFPRVYVGTIEAGEISGTLNDMLDNLANYLEADIEMRADVRSAVLYPAIVMVFLCMAIAVLIVFVVPRFSAFYSGFGAELPLMTRILIETSSLLADHLFAFAAGGSLLVFGAVRLFRTKPGKRIIDHALLRIPFIGRLIETAVTLHAVQTLGLFTRAGVPILESIRTIAGMTANTKYRENLLSVAGGIAVGQTLADGMEAANCFPPAARHMLANGESTGSMERSCFAVAAQYKKELRYLTKNVATFIEPLLTLALASVVLFVALAVFLPMWDLAKVVGK